MRFFTLPEVLSGNLSRTAKRYCLSAFTLLILVVFLAVTLVFRAGRTRAAVSLGLPCRTDTCFFGGQYYIISDMPGVPPESMQHEITKSTKDGHRTLRVWGRVKRPIPPTAEFGSRGRPELPDATYYVEIEIPRFIHGAPQCIPGDGQFIAYWPFDPEEAGPSAAPAAASK